MREKLLKMLKQLLSGEYNCNAFSYDFPLALFGASEELMDILDDVPEICLMYDPYKENEEDLYNDEE